MQKFVNVRTTAESVKPLEIDDYHVYVNTGIKEIHEEAKEGDLSSGFDGFEIETQEIYEKDEYIQLIAEKFQSTLPREERRYRGLWSLICYRISIHAPTRGATRRW